MDVVLDGGGGRLDALVVVADILSPYLASAELSAISRARWRSSRARSTSTAASPVSSSTACRSASTWWTATTGSRPGTGSARPAPRACGGTRWWAGRCSRCSPASRRRSSAPSSTGSSPPARSSSGRSRWPPGGETRYFRLSKIPMRLEGDGITHVITIGEDVTEWQRIQARITAEREARRHRPARRRASCTRSTIRSRRSAPVSRRSRDGCPSEVAPAPSAVAEYLEIIDKEVDRCTRIVDGLLDFSRPKGKAKRPVAAQRVGGRDALPAQASPALQAARRWRASSTPALPADDRQRGAAHPGAHGAHAQCARRAWNEGGTLTLRTGRSAGRADEVDRGGRGHRGRHPPRGTGQDLRAVLHHQAAGPGHRARAVDLLRHRRGPPAAGSRWTARRAGAPSSGSTCRCAA